MSSFRRIAAACALVAVMAMGVMAPAQSGAGRADSAASAGSLDTALVCASARRGRARGGGAELDGQSSGQRSGPLALFHPLWLMAERPFPPPPAAVAGASAPGRACAPSAPLLASRSSRGPPPFVAL